MNNYTINEINNLMLYFAVLIMGILILFLYIKVVEKYIKKNKILNLEVEQLTREKQLLQENEIALIEQLDDVFDSALALTFENKKNCKQLNEKNEKIKILERKNKNLKRKIQTFKVQKKVRRK